MAKKKQKKQFEQQNSIDAMLERFTPLLNNEDTQKLLMELQKPVYPSFRINPLKVEQIEKINQWAEQYQWQLDRIPYCDQGFWVKSSPFPISKPIEHQLGHYYIQDAASMLPVELFDFDTSSHPIILDMAASPGGKTTHLVSKTNDKALILANDSSRNRLTALKIVLQNWGASHVAVTNYPGDYFGSWFPETFDRILLDAPCSMQGLRESDAHAIKPITQKEINQLAKRQLKLLDSALKALKVGGQVVYSTCTLTVEENEMVLDSILNTYQEKIQFDPIEKILQKSAPGLTKYLQNQFQPQVRNAARIWPFTFGTAGFFAARITKTTSIDSDFRSPPARSLSAANWYPISEKLLYDIDVALGDIYGFSLTHLIDDKNWEIWQNNNNLYCFPCSFLSNFPDLPVQALGLLLGKIVVNELQLSHEFVTRFGSFIHKNVFTLDEKQLADWMRGEDLNMQSNLNSNIQIIKDALERVIGRGKPSGVRLRNMMPKRVLF